MSIRYAGEIVADVGGGSVEAGDGLSKEGNTLSVDIPVRDLTQAEYDALSAEQKSKGLIFLPDDGDDSGNQPSSAGEIYSLEERKIGTWIDGKPLYRRTFSVTPTGSANNWISVSDPIQNIDTVCSLNGAFYHDTNDASYAVPFFAGAPYGCSIGYSYTSGIIIFATTVQYLGVRYLINITYTKTTDPEVSA